MKLVKNTLALAICSVVALPTFAANVDIYGRADVSFQVADGIDDKKNVGSFTEVKSNASRIGFKGTQTLNDDLTLVYKAEFEVDIDGDGDTFKKRNQYIGLKGAFGEVLLGRNDSMLKQSQGKTDLFSDLNGDIKKLWEGENRLNDTVSYKSPKFSGFQLGVTYQAEDEVDGNNALSVAAFYGDKKLKKSDVFASVAVDSEVDGFDTIRATVQGKISGVTLGLMIQNQEEISSGAEVNGIMVSAKYKVGTATTLKGQYQLANEKNGDDLSGITLGVDYKLADNTKLYAFFTGFDMDTGHDEDYAAVGIQYKF